MIVALEGPDRAGKTTAFELLRQKTRGVRVYVPGMPMHKELLPVMPWVELRQAALWEALHDPSKVYICDRCVFTSAPVYDAFFERPCLIDWKAWRDRLRVVYFELAPATLQARRDRTGDECFDGSYSDIQRLYEGVLLPHVEVFRVDAAQPPAYIAEAIDWKVSEWSRYL